MQKIIQKIINLINPVLRKLENPYVMGTVSIFLVLYGALVKPELPNFIKNLFNNSIFKVCYIFLLSFIADKNISVAIVVAFIFMICFGLLSEFQVQESFTDIPENLEEKLNVLLDELSAEDEVSQKANVDMEEGDMGDMNMNNQNNEEIINQDDME